MSKETPPKIETASTLRSTYSPTMERLSGVGWEVANFVTVLAVTSASIVMVQSPISGLILNKIKLGRAMPDTNAGILVAVRTLYAGAGSNLAASSARTVYVTGAKKNGHGTETNEGPVVEEGPHEIAIESNDGQKLTKNAHAHYGKVAIFALGDACVTQIPEVKGQLTKLNIIDHHFKWRGAHNLFRLSKAGLGVRFSTSLVNFSALCVVEGHYAELIPIRDPVLKHFVAGAASGMTAAVSTLPLTYYRDFRLSRATVVDGKLVMPRPLNIMNMALGHIKQVGVVHALTQVAQQFVVQAPLRMLSVGATFALVSSISEALGKEPLAFLDMERSPTGIRSNESIFSFFSSQKISKKQTSAEPAIESQAETSADHSHCR